MTLSVFVNYKFSNRWAVEAGYGYEDSRRDGWNDGDRARPYTFQAPNALADGVTVTLEFSMFDAMDDETKLSEGTETWLGAKVQINF